MNICDMRGTEAAAGKAVTAVLSIGLCAEGKY